MSFNTEYNKVMEKFTIGKDDTRAKGTFSKGDMVGVVKYDDTITVLGKGLKKSETPNVSVVHKNDKYLAVAKSNISKGDSLTASPANLSYRKDKEDKEDKEDSTKTVVLKLKNKSRIKLGA